MHLWVVYYKNQLIGVAEGFSFLIAELAMHGFSGNRISAK